MKTLVKILMLLTMISLLVTNVNAQELTIYVLPSPYDRDWESPRELIVTTIKNIFYPENYKKHIIGHVFIQLSDGDENYMTGSTAAKDLDLKKLVLENGYGLGILNADIRGRLEDQEDLSHELAMRFTHGNISFIRFKISDEMFARLAYYLNEYDKRDYDTIYNGQNKPREGKGAGCSAFAVSFMEVAGFLTNELAEKWQKNVRIPVSLVGGPRYKKRINAWKVIKEMAWAKNDEPHVETCFYDPNSMHNWILNQFNQDTTNAQVVKYNRAIGLIYDYSDKEPPKEAIFYK